MISVCRDHGCNEKPEMVRCVAGEDLGERLRKSTVYKNKNNVSQTI